MELCGNFVVFCLLNLSNKCVWILTRSACSYAWVQFKHRIVKSEILTNFPPLHRAAGRCLKAFYLEAKHNVSLLPGEEIVGKESSSRIYTRRMVNCSFLHSLTDQWASIRMLQIQFCTRFEERTCLHVCENIILSINWLLQSPSVPFFVLTHSTLVNALI